MIAARRILLIAAATGFVAAAATVACADDEPPIFRERRFDPYVTPDPRHCAPSLGQAIGSGLLPPFDWGWNGLGYTGWWGGVPWGGYGYSAWGGYHRYPYPYGYNGRFWFPNGPTWPYGSLAPNLGSDFGPLPPLGYSIYPLQFPFVTGNGNGDAAEHLGPY